MALSVEQIVNAGMATFADTGYENFSMRLVAQRLGVQVGSLYHHVRNRSALLALLADRVATEAYDMGSTALARLPEGAGWADRVQAQAIALRSSIGRHQGGAALLAASPRAGSSGALAIMERLLATVEDAGVQPDWGIVAADSVLSHVTGFVLQQQPPAQTDKDDTAWPSDLADRYPRTTAGAARYSEDALFRASLELLCAGVAAIATGSPRDRVAGPRT